MQPSAKRVEPPQEEIDDEIDVDDHGSRQLCILGGTEASAPSLPNNSVPAPETYQHHASNEPERSPQRETHHNQRGDQHNQQDDSFPRPAASSNHRGNQQVNGSLSTESGSSSTGMISFSYSP
ncbi:MAG: hypothetical protein ACK518_02800 [bacterium]